MSRYIADVFFLADRPFELAAEEINKLIAPHVLRSTDRFDEVPGYVAHFGKVEVALQGIPADATAEEIGEEPLYYLEVRAEADEMAELPSWLRVPPIDKAEVKHGYIDLSSCVAQRVMEVTSLRCVKEQ